MTVVTYESLWVPAAFGWTLTLQTGRRYAPGTRPPSVRCGLGLSLGVPHFVFGLPSRLGRD